MLTSIPYAIKDHLNKLKQVLSVSLKLIFPSLCKTVMCLFSVGFGRKTGSCFPL